MWLDAFFFCFLWLFCLAAAALERGQRDQRFLIAGLCRSKFHQFPQRRSLSAATFSLCSPQPADVTVKMELKPWLLPLSRLNMKSPKTSRCSRYLFLFIGIFHWVDPFGLVLFVTKKDSTFVDCWSIRMKPKRICQRCPMSLFHHHIRLLAGPRRCFRGGRFHVRSRVFEALPSLNGFLKKC